MLCAVRRRPFAHRLSRNGVPQSDAGIDSKHRAGIPAQNQSHGADDRARLRVAGCSGGRPRRGAPMSPIELPAGIYTGKETPPQGTIPKPFNLPPTTDYALPNGMRVTMVPYGSVPKVAVRAFVAA